ncbi:hypothetical protein OXPF_37480 [Oxobacter pfennigii]|uniref:Putative zinc-finger domain-containing protein n=1 Tax=Oxobacter pfennigii TaxID=36849 RepID=A0A0P8Y7X6_9CLOT|nr:zf-HC2 domain-containing protein [Oxobacter pfennigii]KPU42694.1 hypothetical protein OXPF_37480 [Oxobacter pfennigii]
MKLSCDVICDLLPGYAEGMTSEDSNRLVQEHLDNCPQCLALLQSMKEDMQTELPAQTEIAPFRKYRRRIQSWKVLCGLFALLLVALCIPAVVAQVDSYHRLWMKQHPHQIDEIIAMDCATEQKLILPFSYDSGAVQDDGVKYYDGTYFVSDETALELAERINSWGLKNCTARVIDDTSLLVSYGNSRYRMYQTNGKWYNWCFEGLSYKFNNYYYQFPIYLCQSADTVIDEFNNSPNELTSVADYEDFVDFYTDSGLYRFTAREGTIVLLGYVNEAMQNEGLPFPLTMNFTETDGILTITIQKVIIQVP